MQVSKDKILIPPKYLLVLVILSLGIMSVVYSQIRISGLPKIRGVIIPEGRPLSPFSIVDHNNRKFGNANLLGRWSLVAYGYTNCPDICPNTLNILTQMKNQLASSSPVYDDLTVLFYSIDHQRDTVIHLSEYMPFFHQEFLGLTYTTSMEDAALSFETSLGIKYELTPLSDLEKNEFTGDYAVAHGVMLYLINPQGHLQAVFKPQKNKEGIQHFNSEKLLADYLTLRRYFAQT